MKLLRTFAALSLLALGSAAMAQTGGMLSPRLIVKYKASPAMATMSAQQIQAQLRQPLTAASVQSLSASAGMALGYARPTALSSHVLQLPTGATPADVQKAIQKLKQRSDIEYVEEDAIMQPMAVPTDPLYPTLWGMQPVGGAPKKYGADFQTAWDSATGSGVVVAVLDTGILPHPDIVGPSGTVFPTATGNLVSPGYDFIQDCRYRGTCSLMTPSTSTTVAPSPNATDLGDWITAADASATGCTQHNSSWHGTHVAGTIAALGNNGVGVIGGAYQAKILPVRVLGHCGGRLSDIIDGVLWAAGLHPTISNPTPAKVINMSLGGASPCSSSPSYQTAFNKVYAAGVATIVAAGNSNTGVANFSPASCNNVITIAATDSSGVRAYYSNYDDLTTSATKYIALAAQGGAQSFANDPSGINSTLSNSTASYAAGSDNYVYYQGTSMATPHAAAAVALMLSKNPSLTPAQVRAILTSSKSVTAFPTTGTTLDCSTQCGVGILNAQLAVQNANNALSPSQTAVDFGVKAVNTTTALTITYTNPSAVLSSSVQVAALSGTGAAAYKITADTCSNTSVAASGTCSLSVSYAPTGVGGSMAALTLPTANGSAIVALTGWAGSKLNVDATSKTVPSLSMGSSATVTSTFTNSTAGNLTIASPILNSTIMAVSSDTCSNKTLAAGTNCSVTVKVTPTTAGNYTSALSLNSTGASDIAQVVTISGTATTPSPTPTPSTGGGGGGGGCTMLPPGEDRMTIDLSLAAYAALAGLMLVLRSRQRAMRR